MLLLTGSWWLRCLWTPRDAGGGIMIGGLSSWQNCYAAYQNCKAHEKANKACQIALIVPDHCQVDSPDHPVECCRYGGRPPYDPGPPGPNTWQWPHDPPGTPPCFRCAEACWRGLTCCNDLAVTMGRLYYPWPLVMSIQRANLS